MTAFLNRDAARMAVAEYAEKALEAAQEFDDARKQVGINMRAEDHAMAEVSRVAVSHYATCAQVYAATATAVAAALETGAIR